MTDNPRVRGWIALGLVYFCWSSTYLAIRIGVGSVPPLLLAAARFLLPGTILYAATWRQAGARWSWLHWRSAVIIGLLLMAGGNGGVTLGELTVPSGIASLLIATVPFWMVLIDALKQRQLVRRGQAAIAAEAHLDGVPIDALERRQLVRRDQAAIAAEAHLDGVSIDALERRQLVRRDQAAIAAEASLDGVPSDAIKQRRLVRPLVVGGLLVGFGGMVLLLRPSGGGRVDPRGAAFILVGGLVWAAGSIYSRTAPQAQPPLRAIAMDMLAGGVALAVLGFATGEGPRLHWTSSGVLAILWLSVVGSLIGFSAYLYALRLLPAATVSTYAFVNPLLAVLLGAAILHETVTGQTVAAMLVTLLGVGLIVLARAREPSP